MPFKPAKGQYLVAGLTDMHVHLAFREEIKQVQTIAPDLIVSSPAINQKTDYLGKITKVLYEQNYR